MGTGVCPQERKAPTRRWVTCGSSSRTGVMLSGSGLADSGLCNTPPGWRLSVHFFGKVSLPYDGFIVGEHRADDKKQRNNNNVRDTFLLNI